MKTIFKSLVIITMFLSVSYNGICSNDGPSPSPEKKIEKITVYVNGNSYIVWVNKTMIDMVKNSDTSEHQSSSVIYPAGYSGSSFSTLWNSYMQNRNTNEILSESVDK